MKQLLVSVVLAIVATAVGLTVWADIRHNRQMAIIAVFIQARVSVLQLSPLALELWTGIPSSSK
jgi:hypothetical protein